MSPSCISNEKGEIHCDFCECDKFLGNLYQFLQIQQKKNDPAKSESMISRELSVK